ncbi:MAG: DUF4062 domain-containing protein [bacterium]|nr:DUF4062 domain-containing protein [bacterium]
MAAIYISSTYNDLIAEREAAASAIRRLGHRPLAMEDYVATDKRPVDKCIEDVCSCSVYVGIIGRRYGFIPDGYEKSITHLEYEAAEKAGIPRLIFILEERADWPEEFVSVGEEGEKQKQFRDYLQNALTVSFFAGAEDLLSKVTASVAIKLTPKPLKEKKSKRGSIISKMCDRVVQVKDFQQFFQSNFEKHPTQPQFYFIHGDELAGHEMFLERLMKTRLKEFAEKQWGEEFATIKLEKVPWPKEGKPEEQQDLLCFKLNNAFEHAAGGSGADAAGLSKLPSLEKRPLVLIKHDIYSSKWDKYTIPMITWYIKEYWGTLEPSEDIPLFLIFFNIKYQETKESGFKGLFSRKKAGDKERIMEELEQISKSLQNHSPCLLLNQLSELEIEDVLNWFDAHDIFDDELERQERAKDIFKDTHKFTPVQFKSMAKVQRRLKKIVEEHQQEEL